ncbi:hypothetical protein [Vulcanisaeta distributa]|nr:hypothetical protein [Vulcanisaeta distributa]
MRCIECLWIALALAALAAQFLIHSLNPPALQGHALFAAMATQPRVTYL